VKICVSITSLPEPRGTGGWVGPRAGLDTEARGKNPLPLPGIEPRSPGCPARSQTLYCLSYHYAGANGDRGYNFYSFLTSALDGGEWSASRPGQALPPGKGPPVPSGYEAGRASELVWSQRLEIKSFVSPGDRTTVVQFVVTRFTDSATPTKNVVQSHKPKYLPCAIFSKTHSCESH
jgi:hypothetical protein